jgi:hypothetical protein
MGERSRVNVHVVRGTHCVEENIAIIAHTRFPGIPGELAGIIPHASCFTIKTK